MNKEINDREKGGKVIFHSVRHTSLSQFSAQPTHNTASYDIADSSKLDRVTYSLGNELLTTEALDSFPITACIPS